MEFIFIQLDNCNHWRTIFKIVLLPVILLRMIFLTSCSVCVGGTWGGEALVTVFRLPQTIKLQISHKMGHLFTFVHFITMECTSNLNHCSLKCYHKATNTDRRTDTHYWSLWQGLVVLSWKRRSSTETTGLLTQKIGIDRATNPKSCIVGS